MKKPINFKELEKRVGKFVSEVRHPSSVEAASRLILHEGNFGIGQRDNKKHITFHNRHGLEEKPERECLELELQLYNAIKNKEALPRECQDCRQIFVHPRKIAVPYFTVLIGLLESMRNAKKLPVIGQTLKSLSKDSPLRDRLIFYAYNPKSMMNILHHLYTTLKGAEEYGDNKDQPNFTLHFSPDKKKNSMIYVRDGCDLSRSFAKNLRKFNHYFNEQGTLYKNVPITQSEA